MHMPLAEMVTVGSRVRLSDADGVEEYVLVPDEEVDATAGRISTNCPLARAVLGRSVGEQVLVRAPGGVRRITIAAVNT